MKKVTAVILILMLITVLAGCTMPSWQVDSELGNGVWAVVPEQKEEDAQWYCAVDTEAGDILSINLIFPESFGAPTDTICTVDGKDADCTVTSGERDSGGVLFFTLPTENTKLENNNKIVITQNFENGKATLKFTPQKVAAAFETQERE